MKAKGLNLPKNYNNFTSLKELINIMAQEVQHDIITEIQRSKYFSIVIDSSSDTGRSQINWESQLILKLKLLLL